jgi:thimet oligopeptidase
VTHEAGAPANPAAPTRAAAGQAPLWTAVATAEELQGACAALLERARGGIDRLLAVHGPRTHANTLQPYDDALAALDALASQASLLENVHPDAAFRAAAETATQEAAAFGTELSLHRGVYDALAALDVSSADAATRHYVGKTLREFQLSGVDRDEETRRRIRALNQELVLVGQEFARNIRADVRSVTVAGPGALEGLPEDYVARHVPAADGSITITTEYPDATPVFLYARRDDLRRRLYLEYNNRAHPGNVAVLERLIARRHELATLVGFRSWADYLTANRMVGSATRVAEFIDRIVDASDARARADYATLLERKRRDDPGAAGLVAWETGYYSELVRKSAYDFDAQSVRPYFPFARVKQGVLDVLGRIFGVSFRRDDAARGWHPSVECWEMWEEGVLAGRVWLDMHPRPDKYSHAAQFDVFTGVAGRQIPEAALVCNFPGGPAGDAGLMEHGDVRTLFHEFGHLLHNLFAGRQRWTGIGGIRTEHDFVEVPSQLLEEWAWDPGVLATFARHWQTDEPIPAALVRQMKRASEFGKGLAVRRQMVFAALSLALYDRPPDQVDPDAVVREFTGRYQPVPHVDGTHMQCSFGHLEGYSAGYYTYMWSLVIAKDMLSRFDRDGLLDPGPATRYRRLVLEPGGSQPAAEIVEGFLGRPFGFEAYERWLNDMP